MHESRSVARILDASYARMKVVSLIVNSNDQKRIRANIESNKKKIDKIGQKFVIVIILMLLFYIDLRVM